MINYLTKKTTAVFITVAILFTTVFSVSIFANAVTSFSPRLSAPSKKNNYYYSDKNIFYKYGYGMPNCTAYAFGRAYELLKKEPQLCHYDAQEWYDYNKDGGYYSYGNTPKLGAIACWSYSGGGHVAVVEKIEDGKITFSNSAWNSDNFYLTYAKTSDPNAGESKWNFQGYIYIGDFSNPSANETTESPSEYKTGIYQVDVYSYLNMRSGAGTSHSQVASVPDGAKLTVTQIKDAEGYTWGHTTYKGTNGWVALDYCNFISENSEPESTTAPETQLPTEPTIQQITQPATNHLSEPSQGFVESKVGEINGDGEINILDVTLIQKYLVCKVKFTDDQIKNSDINHNGKVDVNDVTALQKYLVKLSS